MRAIILAAGMGTRLRPLTYTTPKPLTVVNGKPMLERQVEYLHEIGITDIIVLTGYLHEKYEYLIDKYGLKLVHNDKYQVFNNIYTMYLVKDYLPGAYVIDGDNYLARNFLLKEEPKTSLYFSAVKSFKDEWRILFDEDDKVTGIDIPTYEGEDYILCGTSYWTKEDGEKIVKQLENVIEGGNFTDLFWDDIVKDNMNELNIYMHKLQPGDTYEIDSVADLERVNKLLTV